MRYFHVILIGCLICACGAKKSHVESAHSEKKKEPDQQKSLVASLPVASIETPNRQYARLGKMILKIGGKEYTTEEFVLNDKNGAGSPNRIEWTRKGELPSIILVFEAPSLEGMMSFSGQDAVKNSIQGKYDIASEGDGIFSANIHYKDHNGHTGLFTFESGVAQVKQVNQQGAFDVVLKGKGMHIPNMSKMSNMQKGISAKLEVRLVIEEVNVDGKRLYAQ